jgi:hypothetical protein
VIDGTAILLKARRAGLLAELTVIEVEIAKLEAPAARNAELPDLAEAKDRSRPDDLRPSEYRVWIALAKSISETGDHPRYREFGERLGISSATLKIYLQNLRKKGYVKITGRAHSTRNHILRWPDGIAPRETQAPALAEVKKPARVQPGTYATRTPTGEPKAARRFTDKMELDPESVTGLADDHPAITEERTLFPTTVVDPVDSPRLLVSGQNSRKLGSHVTKGPWKGFPIYSLTLEERATCPRSCHAYSTCYGNGTPFARRHRHGPALVDKLGDELDALAADHPAGFVVRLHQLGDFYSNDYVTSWWLWLIRIKSLHVFGYTAHDPESKIGLAVSELNKKFPGRCAIRYSSADSLPNGATVIDYLPTTPRVPEGIICPAQRKAHICCGSCGLCWHPAVRDKTIVFIKHGNKMEGRPPAKIPKAKGAYAPKKPGYQRAIVPSTVDEVAEANLDVTFPAPMQRRCPRCNQVFGCRNLNEVICPTCSSSHALSNGAATTHGGTR